MRVRISRHLANLSRTLLERCKGIGIKLRYDKRASFLYSLQLDLNNDGTLSAREVGSAFEAVGEKIPGFKLREIIGEVDKNKDGVISFDEFVEVSNALLSRFFFFFFF